MANEVQFWSTTKPDDICPTHYVVEKGQALSIMNGLPLLLFKLPEMPLFPPESVLKKGEGREKRCTHTRDLGANQKVPVCANLKGATACATSCIG
jgi:hypothetical protein